MQKLNFPGTHWRGLALIGAQKKPCHCPLWYSKNIILTCFPFFIGMVPERPRQVASH